jgi:peptide-methionine (S)-S-oxide reductase
MVSVESGYCNGHLPQPTYEEVCTGNSGHNEVVKLEFDTSAITVREVLEIFFVIHDPTTLNRQGHDVGTQYRSGIYCSDAAQLAEVQKPKMKKVRPLFSDKDIWIPVDTPYCCDPSTETYWCM